jgi:hypothetical protein
LILLVVEEEVEHDDLGPEGRRLPGLILDLSQDFGRIEPHRSGLPASVEAALFGLLTIAWEEIVEYEDMDWRGFRLPWVYTLDSDVFARRLPPSSADSLTWEPISGFDTDGSEYEYERPIAFPLSEKSDTAISWLDDAAWEKIMTARAGTLFQRPVAHFFVRGFQLDGIDEFLAHISTIEEALGSPVDHHGSVRRKIGGKNPGATQRVALRMSALLNDASTGPSYTTLFGLRSDFLHGKPMADVSGSDRRLARELARKVVWALIGIGSADPTANRDQFLEALFDKALIP